jgi:hypothetical protein
LFGIEFNDDRAEEQFTVYDHPKALIYRKTDDYNRERVRAMLSDGIDWNNIPYWLNPRDVPGWKRTNQQQNDLMLTEAQRQVQEQGGTWASATRVGQPLADPHLVAPAALGWSYH